MSVRQNRKKQKQVIDDRLEQLRFQKGRNDAEEKALLEAQAALAEEPRALTSCELQREYLTVTVYTVDKMHCTECGKTVIAQVDDELSFCPKCGSKVTASPRDASPYERHTQNTVAEAMQGLCVTKGIQIRK